MVESHVLSQVGITASWRRRYKAGKPSERLTSSAGRLLSTHHNRQPQAATATKKNQSAWPAGNECSPEDAHTVHATHPSPHMHTITPTHKHHSHTRLQTWATSMSIRTLIKELHVEDTCWDWDRDRALSVWVNAADDIAMRWLTVSSSSSSPLPSSRRCCCRCCWVPSYQLGRHAHCPACLRRQNPPLPGWQLILGTPLV